MTAKNPFKSDEIYGYQTLHREIGYYISRLEHYDKALKFFDEAIKKTPSDTRALMGRSRARAKATQYEGALEDVNKVLSVDADDIVVLADKAQNVYLCCEFEESLVENFRLLPKRQKPDHFAIGVMQCSDAIENCMGERTGRPLRDHFEIIRRLAWKKNYEAQKPFEPTASGKTRKKKPAFFKHVVDQGKTLDHVHPNILKMRGSKGPKESPELDIKDSLHSRKPEDNSVPSLTEAFPFKPLQNYTSNIRNYMAEKYLDSMYLDKVFLEKIQTTAGASCPNLKGSIKIKHLARTCHKTVSYKQELLRTRRPFYFIKYQEAKVSGTLQKRQQLELEHQQRTIKREADAILNKMLNVYNDKKLKQFLETVEKLKRFCDSKPKKLIPDKSIYMNEVYDKVCKAFYEVYRLNESQGEFQQNKRLFTFLGIPLSREASTDSVINEFASQFLNYKKEIDEFKKRLTNASIPEEICWYFHELSRYHLETKQFDLCRLYAKKGIQTAKIIDNNRWIFNCKMIMAKSNVLQQNRNDARNDLLEAMKCTKLLNDREKYDFVEKCLEAVETVELGDATGMKELERREKKIVQMMASSHMKDEVAHLFRQMSAMPSSRRMTVIPGVKGTSISGPKGGGKSRALSIMPGRKDSKLDVGFDKGKNSIRDSKPETSRGIAFKDLFPD